MKRETLNKIYFANITGDKFWNHTGRSSSPTRRSLNET